MSRFIRSPERNTSRSTASRSMRLPLASKRRAIQLLSGVPVCAVKFTALPADLSCLINESRPSGSIPVGSVMTTVHQSGMSAKSAVVRSSRHLFTSNPRSSTNVLSPKNGMASSASAISFAAGAGESMRFALNSSPSVPTHAARRRETKSARR